MTRTTLTLGRPDGNRPQYVATDYTRCIIWPVTYIGTRTNLDFTDARETVSGSGISWAICKSAPRPRQITMTASHHSVFTGQMPFLPPNQQRLSTEYSIQEVMLFYLSHTFIHNPHSISTPRNLLNVFITFVNVFLFFNVFKNIFKSSKN